MNIQLHPLQSFSETGKRPRNEDSLYPSLGSTPLIPSLFLVCDGVGGSSKGEIASKLVCQGFPEVFAKSPPPEPLSSAYLQEGLREVEKKISDRIQASGSFQNTATTLSLLYFDAQGAMLAWVGDSRIYQFRQGKLLYRTEDHSLVNELVKQGHLKAEEAVNHPRRNVILRAIKGSHERTELETHRLSDIQAGDIFLLCTDGLLEKWSDASLAELMESRLTLNEIKNSLLLRSLNQTRDNFSAMLVQVKSTSPKNGTGVVKKRRIPRAIVALGILFLLIWGWKRLGNRANKQESLRLLNEGTEAYRTQNYERVISAYDSLFALDKDSLWVKGSLRIQATRQRDSAWARLDRLQEVADQENAGEEESEK